MRAVEGRLGLQAESSAGVCEAPRSTSCWPGPDRAGPPRAQAVDVSHPPSARRDFTAYPSDESRSIGSDLYQDVVEQLGCCAVRAEIRHPQVGINLGTSRTGVLTGEGGDGGGQGFEDGGVGAVGEVEDEEVDAGVAVGGGGFGGEGDGLIQGDVGV